MEKDKFFVDERGNTAPPPTWNICTFPMEKIQPNELNCGSGSNCFLNPDWGSSVDQSDPFESALSSIVSSPATSNTGVISAGGGDSVMIRELIGKLGTICNSGDLSPQSYIASNGNQSTNASCYSTPLNSPPKLNLSTMDSHIRGCIPVPKNHLPSHPNLVTFSTDPGFVERAARFSCFGTGNLSGIHGNLARPELPYRSIPAMDSVQLSRVSPTNLSVKAAGSQLGSQDSNRRLTHEANILFRSSTPENGEFRESPEGSLHSERTAGAELSTKGESDSGSRKRKSIPKGKSRETTHSLSAKDNMGGVETEESNSKKRKSDEATGNQNDAAKAKTEADSNAGEGDQKQDKDSPKPPEPPKDYIHVRARRGQATDSHSLAERVRREKISERMKFLQDLVPGCNKVTGKAVMLDEIINYVQSLQRQVEFLSMKLATVNPRMDVNMDALLSKDVFQSRGNLQHALYSLDSSMLAFPYGCQPHTLPPQLGSNSAVVNGQFSMNTMNAAALHKNPEMHMAPVGGLSENTTPVPSIWEDDLQSLVQMGFGQNQ